MPDQAQSALPPFLGQPAPFAQCCSTAEGRGRRRRNPCCGKPGLQRIPDPLRMLTQSVCPLLWDSCSNSSVNLLLSVFNKWQQHFPFLAPPGLYPDITGDLGVSVPAHQHLHPAPALLDPAKAWENISAVPWVPLPHFIEFSVLQAQQWLHHSSCSGGPRQAVCTHLHWNCPFPCTKTTPFPFSQLFTSIPRHTSEDPSGM